MKIPRFRSLAFKLTLWYILILGIIITLSMVFLYQRFKESLRDELDEKLLEIAVEVVDEAWRWNEDVDWPEGIRRGRDEFRFHRPLIQVVQLVDRESGEIEWIRRSEPPPPEAFTLEGEFYARAYRADFNDLVYVTLDEPGLGAYPVRTFLYPAWKDLVIQVGISLEQNIQAARRLLVILLASGPLLLALVSLGGHFFILKALKPVRSVVEAAGRISADDLSLRIDAGNRKDEIGALVETFNDMLDRLDHSVSRIRQFSGDVSHELRTPLTIIRGEMEVALRKPRPAEEYQAVLESALEESHRMERLIDDLLLLSRMEESGARTFEQRVDLAVLLERVYGSRLPAAEKKGVRLEVTSAAAWEVPGDETLLERLIGNLVDNAVRYTPAGGRVELMLGREDGAVVLSVRDTGIGIPKEAQPRIFDRFFVVDPSRCRESGGAGLGLAIVKQVAELHGARVDLESEPGKGTLFRILFPV
jgi:heavy metal sensor kinase